MSMLTEPVVLRLERILTERQFTYGAKYFVIDIVQLILCMARCTVNEVLNSSKQLCWRSKPRAARLSSAER